MVIEIILVLGGLALAIFLVARTNLMHGGDIPMWMWRKYPKYENLDKNTMGRIAGSSGMTKKEGGYVDIRYKKGLFSADVDRDIPQEFIKYIESPETPIKEGIVRVYPFTLGKPTYFKIWDTYKDLVTTYEENFKLMEAHLKNIDEMMKTKIDRRRLFEELDSVSKVLGRLYENLKAKKPEISTFTLERPAPEKKEEKKEEKKT